MNDSNVILPAHRELIQSLIDGTLEPVESSRVNALLRDDIVLREFYIQQIRTDEQLCAHFEEPSSLVLLSHPKAVSRRKHITAIAVSVTLGMAAAIALMFTFWKGQFISDEIDATHYSQFIPAPDNTPIARISGVKDVVWAQSSGDLRPGHWLSAGKVELKEGLIELCYDSGSTVLIKAPATYYIEAQNKGYLEKGSIRAHSPKTVAAFEIETPNSELVDLGTTFGVTVLSLVSTEVHVLEGLVKARGITDLDDGWKVLRTGKALRIDSADSIETDYTSITANTSFYDWAPPESVRRMESLEYAHWSFDQIQGDQFPETGRHSGGSHYYATAVDFSADSDDYTWLTAGRFSKALALDGNARFLRTDYPAIGGDEARTVAFWVKLGKDQPKQAPSAGIVSWGQNGVRGKKWQILPYSPLLANKQKVIRTECAWGHAMGSTNINDGQWHHAVSVFMGGHNADVATHVKHYIDGKLESRGSLISRRVDTATSSDPENNFPLVVGVKMETANARSLERLIDLSQAGKIKLSTLNGDIDELYVFNGVLTPQEILQLMEENKAPEN